MAVTSVGQQSVEWTGAMTEPESATIESVDEAVRSWMGDKGITDLSKLGKAELEDLVEYLKTLDTSKFTPEQRVQLDTLTSKLTGLLGRWNESQEDADKTKVDRVLEDIAFQLDFIGLLKNATLANDDGLDAAFDDLQGIASKANGLMELLSEDIDWSDPNLDATKPHVQKLLAQIEGLPVALQEALGLAGLHHDLTMALGELNNASDKLAKIRAGISQPPTKAQEDELRAAERAYFGAVSLFREKVANAKLDYFESRGISDSSPLVKDQLDVIRSEEIWQENADMLTSVVDLTALPQPDINEYKTPAEYIAALKEYRSELLEIQKSLLKVNPALAGEVAQVISDVTTLIQQVQKETDGGVRWGYSPALVAACMNFSIRRLHTEIVSKTRLAAEAEGRGDSKLAEQIRTQITELQSILTFMNSSLEKMMDAIHSTSAQLGRSLQEM